MNSESLDLTKASIKISVSTFGLFLVWSTMDLSAWASFCPFSENDPCQCSLPPDDLSVQCDNTDVKRLASMMDKMRNFRQIPAVHLQVSNANLTGIESGMFSQLTLKSISFDSSILKTSSAELFSGIDSTLEDLQFRWCYLGFPLSRWTIGHLPRLRRLVVAKTPLMSIPGNFLSARSSRLKSIFLYGNDIANVETGALHVAFSLQVLVLNNNKIKTLSRAVFPRPAPELLELHLRDNLLEELSASIWEDMTSLKLVDLSANRLHTLNEATWKPIWGQLTDVYLQDNLLHCGCDIRWLIQEENKMSKEKKFARFLLGSCISPEYLRKKHLENLITGDLPC